MVTAAGRINAVMTGVPVTAAGATTSSTTAHIDTPVSTNSYAASGTISVNSSAANTEGALRATHTLTRGPTIDTGYSRANATTGAYSMTLPAGAPVKLAFTAGATAFIVAGNALDAGKYKLKANVPSFDTKTADIILTSDIETNFEFHH